jgi:iron complex outermembrane receptor protein
MVRKKRQGLPSPTCADYAIGHGFSVNASVNNLFDTRYYYSEGFIEEGRNFWAGVEYEF